VNSANFIWYPVTADSNKEEELRLLAQDRVPATLYRYPLVEDNGSVYAQLPVWVPAVKVV
jgi:hypothetical protein